MWSFLFKDGEATEQREIADSELRIVSFGRDAAGEMYLVDHQGVIHELVKNAEIGNTGDFPRKLSETGLFLDMETLEPSAGVLPYWVNVPAWNDGATGERHFGIPSDEKLADHLNQNPEIASWSAKTRQRQAALDLARAGAVPDVTAGVGYRHFRGDGEKDHAIVAGVAIPIPLFDRNQGEILKARYSLLRAKAQRRAAVVELHTKFGRAYQTLASAYSEAVALRDEVLPAAKSSYTASGKSFEHGKGGYLDVLDAQRTLVEIREQYIDALEAYHLAVTSVEGIIAQPLKSISKATRKMKDTKNEK